MKNGSRRTKQQQQHNTINNSPNDEDTPEAKVENKKAKEIWKL